MVPAKPRSDPNQKAWPEAYVPPFHYPDRNLKAGGEAAAPAQATDAPNLETLAENIAKVEHRIQRVADEQAVENLQAAFGYYFDKKLWDEVIALFADDGTFETGQSGVYSGKASIRRYLDAMGAEGLQVGELFHHIELEPVITIAEDGHRANIRVHMIGEIGKFGTSATWRGGIYENSFVQENGVWKIKSIHLYDTFAAPYESGWGKVALSLVDPTNGKAPPPDKPPSVAYKPYPDYFVPPFHFPNPATGKPARLAQAEAKP